jgi:hypothetical protein
MAGQASGPYAMADHGVGPEGEALAGGEERLDFAVGKCGGHHGRYCGRHG